MVLLLFVDQNYPPTDCLPNIRCWFWRYCDKLSTL